MKFKLLLIGILALFASNSFAATTYYVSSTTDNGYTGTPSDGNSGLSKALAKLTIASAITAASSGDTIVINGGAVPQTNSYTPATFHNDTKGLIFQCENYAVLKANGAQARVFNQNTTANTTITGCAIDAENTSTTPITISSAASAPTITITNNIIKGGTTYGISNSSANINLIVTGNTITAPRSAVQSVDIAANMSITVTDNSMTSTAQSSGTEGVVKIGASAASAYATISRNTLKATLGVSGSGTNPWGAIHVNNIPALIEYNIISVTGTGATIAGVAATSAAAVLAENGIIRNNVIVHTSNNGSASGYGIIVGADATGTAADNQINYWTIYGNFISGVSGSSPGLHGILCGFVKACYAFNNYVDYADIHLIAKDTTERSLFANNILPHSVGSNGMMRTKGALTTHFVGNNLVTDSTNANKAMYVTIDGATNSTGNVFAGNNIRAPWTVTAAVTVDASQTASFLYNNYDFDGVSGTPFSYQGVTRATVPLWISNVEASGRQLAAQVADRNFWGKISLSNPYNKNPTSGPPVPWGQ